MSEAKGRDKNIAFLENSSSYCNLARYRIMRIHELKPTRVYVNKQVYR